MTSARPPTISAVRPAFARAALGAALWAAAPWIPAARAPAPASVEHGFLALPLVAAPLAFAVVTELVGHDDDARAYRRAARAQPLASAAVLASFTLPRGAVAAALVAPWAALAVLLAACGLRAARGVAGAGKLSVAAAHVFLALGAAWLVLARAGARPAGFAPATVLLAAVHFHFSGWALQVLFAATARAPDDGARRGAVHRGAARLAIAGLALIAAGNLVRAPGVRLAGVAAMVLAVLALAWRTAALARSASGAVRALLGVAAASAASAMALAGVYGAGEALGRAWLSLADMAAAHGLVNALGLVVCGLAGHLARFAADARVERAARACGAPIETG